MRTTILGSGTSSGVPLIHCKCSVCTSSNPKNTRTRASVWIQERDTSVLIDVSPDFRAQALRFKIPRIDAVLLTHPHFDHLGGLEELRSYNFIQDQTIPVFVSPWSKREVRKRYSYLFSKKEYEGGGIAKVDLKPIHEFKAISLGAVEFVPIPYPHGKQKSLGFRYGNTAYIPDCSSLPSASLKALEGLSHLILDCIQIKPHRTHLNLEAALDWANRIRAKQTYLTHLGHNFDHSTWNRKLPKGIQLAFDGMVIEGAKGANKK